MTLFADLILLGRHIRLVKAALKYQENWTQGMSRILCWNGRWPRGM